MNNQDYYNKEYVPQVNKIGKITGYLGVLLSFTPALVLAVVYGILPKPAALLTAFISGASAFGVLWFVEPISYFPVVGAAGTYMAFLSGNISNMRIPCASMAQVAADVEPGTEKGSVVATLGMAVSIVINVSVLTIGAILGTSVLSMLPDTIKAALNYLLPALFGALLVQFGMKMKNEYPDLKFFVSENGMGVEHEDRFRDASGEIQDDYRIEFITEHLQWIFKSIEDGAKCLGYHYWGVIDNWSWNNAFKNRYGMIEVDLMGNYSRKLKKSARWMKGLLEEREAKV